MVSVVEVGSLLGLEVGSEYRSGRGGVDDFCVAGRLSARSCSSLLRGRIDDELKWSVISKQQRLQTSIHLPSKGRQPMPIADASRLCHNLQPIWDCEMNVPNAKQRGLRAALGPSFDKCQEPLEAVDVDLQTKPHAVPTAIPPAPAQQD